MGDRDGQAPTADPATVEGERRPDPRCVVVGEGCASDQAPVLTLAPTEPAPPPKARRARRREKADGITRERLAVLVAVYLALGTARLQAGMPAPHAVPYQLRKAHEDGTAPELTADAKGLLRCLEQLAAGAHGEPMPLPDAEALLVATVRAKVHEHARRDDDFAQGVHATIGALVVKANFAKWITAGRAWLASGGRPAPTRQQPRGRTFVRHAEEESLV
jgi:hypothetical protein